jgi:hypothetical protein
MILYLYVKPIVNPMKRFLHILAALFTVLFLSAQLSAQCTPDPGCLGTLQPGEYCPEEFPPLLINVPYDEVITFMLALEIEREGTTYTLDSMAVDSVRNVPPGMTYSSSANGYVPGTAYCSQLSGTPTQSGVFPITFYLQPFVDFGSGPVSLGQFIDDTSVVVTVYDPLGIDPQQADQFRILPIVPNPFSENTRISFYTTYQDRVSLQVYNILGKLMYEEAQNASSGEQEFEFTGEDLLPGTYFYRVINSRKLYTGKFIKSK